MDKRHSAGAGAQLDDGLHSSLDDESEHISV